MRDKCSVDEYEGVIAAIAAKYTKDVDLRKDCAQEARVVLIGLDCSKAKNPDPFIRMAIRNTILDVLRSYNTGDWYSGRTSRSGHTSKPRYLRIDELLENGSMQIDSDRNLVHSGRSAASLYEAYYHGTMRGG